MENYAFPIETSFFFDTDPPIVEQKCYDPRTEEITFLYPNGTFLHKKTYKQKKRQWLR